MVKNIHDRFTELAEEHKEAPEPVVLDKNEVKTILADSGVANEKLSEFDRHYDETAAITGAVAVADALALRKFLILHHHIRSVNLLSVTIGVASGLNPAGHYDLDPLMQILLRKLRASSKGHTADEIRSLVIAFPAETPVHRQSISGHGSSRITCGITDIRIPCQTPH